MTLRPDGTQPGQLVLASGPTRNRKFESRSLQRGVRCELDLGEGGFADEIAAVPLGLYLLGDTDTPARRLLLPYFPNIGQVADRFL